ncbi:Hormone sensitive lipase, partial [Fasciolopsis buskii]
GEASFPNITGPSETLCSPKSPYSSNGPHCRFDPPDLVGEKKVADAYRTSFSENGTRVLSDRRARAPKSDLDRVRDIQLHQDCFMSPYLASDEMFRQLPPLGIACSTFDPFLDDCLHLAKRACSLQIPIELRVFEDLPHGFLNFAPLGPEFQNASRACMHMVKRLFERCPSTNPMSRD